MAKVTIFVLLSTFKIVWFYFVCTLLFMFKFAQFHIILIISKYEFDN